MNTTHTPGPWFWSQGVDDWELVGAGANRVLFCWNDKTKWKSGLVVGENIKEADARLIAAAPDMYDALTECICGLEVGLDAAQIVSTLGYGRCAAIRSALTQARAALAKARDQ